jgi:proteasome accessory factor C
MVNQSAPIQEVARLLDLVPFLSTHSHISLKELASEFGVTEKAMASELTALSMCGLPGYTPYELIEIFFESGFVTINNHDALDIPRALTQVEVASLLIGLEILRDSALGQDDVLIAKIDALIFEMKSLIGGAIEVGENPMTTFQAIIENAIAKRKSLSIAYLSPIKDEATTRLVDPLELRSERNHLYLVAFCHNAQSVRNFRLDRVQEIEEGGSAISSTGPVDDGNPEVISVRLRVSGDRRSVAEALSISEIASDGEFEVEVFSPEWISKAVIAHAPHLEIVSPKDGREAVAAAARNILALYSS